MRLATPRLVLRRWRAEDLAPLAAINADPDVAFWLGGPRDRAGSDASAAAWEAAFTAHGFGRFAIERDGELIGVCGLMPVRAELAFSGVEIGWRLARQAWGQGYASEAAAAALADGFTRLRLAEILAYTAATNRRSRSVMQRISMRRAPRLDFEHPNLAEGDPLRPHVVYRARPG